ncbi:hypothetical protein [Rossellomorea aquimaris]|uniref:hypothetical protein n=1 Tax=Rossellomorea TaxID=2837508 RepID=UPI0021CC7A40|nr:hypothetical protein [Rossellomorea aquimaris]
MTLMTSLDSPTLLLDYQKFMKNINEITSFAKEHNLAYRPLLKLINPSISRSCSCKQGLSV